MKKRKTPRALQQQANKEPWRRFYMSEDDVIITPAPKPNNSAASVKNRQSRK